MKLEFSRQICEKYASMKFRENHWEPSWSHLGGRTDMTKLIVAFRNFANAPAAPHDSGPPSRVSAQTAGWVWTFIVIYTYGVASSLFCVFDRMDRATLYVICSVRFPWLGRDTKRQAADDVLLQ